MDLPACVDLHSKEPESDAAEDAVLDCLLSFSPRIEKSPEHFAFWLDAAGIAPLFPSLFAWAKAVRNAVVDMGFVDATVVLGFTKFATAACARCTKGVTIFDGPAQESAALGAVSLQCFFLPQKTLHCLDRLDIRTVRDLAALPAAGLLERFGPAILRIHQHASSVLPDPLQPIARETPITASRELDDPETDMTRLAFSARRLLVSIADETRLRHRAVEAIVMALTLDRAPSLCERIRPAEPTLDVVQLADLLRLRLEGLHLKVGVTGIALSAEAVPISLEQLELFKKKQRRDPASANRALARLRAEFGPQSVVRAAIKEGHLPESRFAFVPTERILPALPIQEEASAMHSAEHEGKGTLVRRIYSKPIPLQARPVVSPQGCHFLGMGDAPSVRLAGPYTISGGWWHRAVHRDYYFAETKAGRVLWVYFDQRRRRWFLHGEVE